MSEASVAEVEVKSQKPTEGLQDKPAADKVAQPNISPENTRRLEIRAFSKSTEEGPKARQETAQKILQQRKGLVQVQQKSQSVLTEKGKEVNKAEALEQSRIENEQRWLALRSEFREMVGSWVHRVKRNFSSTARVRESEAKNKILNAFSELSSVKTDAWSAKQDLPRKLEELDRELRVLKEQREALRDKVKSKEELRLFHEKFGKKFDQSQLEIKDLAELEQYRKEHGTVREIADRFDAYVVHSFLLEKGGRNNEFLSLLATWKEKLIIAAAERNPLSVSTITKGVPREIFTPIGVFMGAGVVNDASLVDVGTVVLPSGKKYFPGYGSKNMQEYKENLAKAITYKQSPDKNGVLYGFPWNELILDDNPRAVGFFVNLDQYTATYGDDRMGNGFTSRGLSRYFGPFRYDWVENVYFTEMFEAAHFVGLQTFAIKDGVAHEASLDSNGELVLGKTISPKEMVALEPEIPPENLPKVREIVSQFVKPNGKSMTSATV